MIGRIEQKADFLRRIRCISMAIQPRQLTASRRPTPFTHRASTLTICLWLPLTIGCTSSTRVTPPRDLSPSDFVRKSPDQGDVLEQSLAEGVGVGGRGEPRDASASGSAFLGTPPVERSRPLPTPPRVPDPVVRVRASVGPPTPIAAATGKPTVPAEATPPSTDGSTTLIRTNLPLAAKVGELNGRTIFADEFFEPIMDELRARAKQPRVTYKAWRDAARQIIGTRLAEIVRDDLLAAEGRARLKPEQRAAGIRAFIEEKNAEAIRTSRGSAAARERALAEQGLTVEQWKREQEQSALAATEINELLDKRVRISWNDMRLYYERERERFNPPGVASVRLIVIDEASKEAADFFADALGQSRPFAEVASDPRNLNAPDQGGAMASKLTLNGEAFSDPALDLAAAKLRAGQHTPEPVRIDAGTKGSPRPQLVWIHIDELESKSRALADPDVQREIYDKLFQEKRSEELARYLKRLFARVDTSEMEDLSTRLLEAASQEIWPDEQSE